MGQEKKSGLASLLNLNGSFVTNTGEIFSGNLRFSKTIEMYYSEIIYFPQSGEKVRYSASEIKELAIGIPSYFEKYADLTDPYLYIYESRPSPKKGVMVYMNRLETGRIAVFENVKASTTEVESTRIDGLGFTYSSTEGLRIGPTYTVVTKYLESRQWQSSYFVEKDGGEMIKISKKNYESQWPYLFDDCQKIQEEIDLNPQLRRFKNFIILVHLYNQLCK